MEIELKHETHFNCCVDPNITFCGGPPDGCDDEVEEVDCDICNQLGKDESFCPNIHFPNCIMTMSDTAQEWILDLYA